MVLPVNLNKSKSTRNILRVQCKYRYSVYIQVRYRFGIAKKIFDEYLRHFQNNSSLPASSWYPFTRLFPNDTEHLHIQRQISLLIFTKIGKSVCESRAKPNSHNLAKSFASEVHIIKKLFFVSCVSMFSSGIPCRAVPAYQPILYPRVGQK